MKVIANTDEYTIYQKRNERYAVRAADRAWVNGDAKITILLEHKLIDVPEPKAPEPEAEPEVVDEAAAEETVAEEAPGRRSAGPKKRPRPKKQRQRRRLRKR